MARNGRGKRKLGFSAVLAAAGAAAAYARRRSSGDDQQPPQAAAAPGPDTPATEVVEQSLTCDCGEEYRFSGEGRHRVHWPAGSDMSDPVLDGNCRTCGNRLPTDHQEMPA